MSEISQPWKNRNSEKLLLNTQSLWAKGNVARKLALWLMGLRDWTHDHKLYYTTLQLTLQPLHHQLSDSTYSGVIAMDVHGQDKGETLIG